MTLLVDKIATPDTYDIKVVQEIIAQSTKNISAAIGLAVIKGMQEKLSFQKLAERHINQKLDEDISNSDEKTKRMYTKLFVASNQHINQFSEQFLGVVFLGIKEDTNNADAPRQFLGSFVISEAKNTLKKLEDQAPESLAEENLEFVFS